MTASEIFVGIDISKNRLDGAIIPGNQTFTHPNNEAGIHQLKRPSQGSQIMKSILKPQTLHLRRYRLESLGYRGNFLGQEIEKQHIIIK